VQRTRHAPYAQFTIFIMVSTFLDSNTFTILVTIIMLSLGATILGTLFGVSKAKEFPPPCVMGDESIMSPKEHGTSATPVQSNLLYNVDNELADRICNYNRHYAENSGYWEDTSFMSDTVDARSAGKSVIFYDSNTGKPLFEAPKGRTWEEFLNESYSHGWPSFRDEEVNWDYVRCLGNGEAVSVDGTHLGHNLPDKTGSRYCINLVSVAGNPTTQIN